MVVGQNGAGKSTLAKVCAGLVTPTAGSVRIMGSVLGDGQRDAGAARPRDGAPALQPAAVVHRRRGAGGDHLGIADRVLPAAARRAAMGRPPPRADDIDTDPSARVRDLPIETRQQLEIARALTGNARVLVLDEPTAVLAPAAIERLFARLRALSTRAASRSCSSCTSCPRCSRSPTRSACSATAQLVLSPTSVSQLSERQLSDEMIGPRRGPDRPAVVERLAAPAPSHRPKIELCSVTSTDNGTEPPLQDVSLVVGEGRIVGIAGVEGNGQRRLANVVAGLEPVVVGDVRIDGRDVTHDTAASRRRAGLCVVPFDRNVEGTSQTSRLWENFAVRQVLASAVRGSRRRGCAPRPARRSTSGVCGTGRADQFAGDLSGGNVQRLILARELSSEATALIAAHPTRGLDFMATGFVRGRAPRARRRRRRRAVDLVGPRRAVRDGRRVGGLPRRAARRLVRATVRPHDGRRRHVGGRDRDDRVDPFRDVDRVLARGLVRPRRADVLGERCQPDRSGQRLDRGRGDGAGRDRRRACAGPCLSS